MECVFSCRSQLGGAGGECGAAGCDAGRQRDAHQRQRSQQEPKPPLRRRESQSRSSLKDLDPDTHATSLLNGSDSSVYSIVEKNHPGIF